MVSSSESCLAAFVILYIQQTKLNQFFCVNFLVLGGGKPLDLCSGGMIWSCCVDRELHQESNPTLGTVHNASKWFD